MPGKRQYDAHLGYRQPQTCGLTKRRVAYAYRTERNRHKAREGATEEKTLKRDRKGTGPLSTCGISHGRTLEQFEQDGVTGSQGDVCYNSAPHRIENETGRCGFR